MRGRFIQARGLRSRGSTLSSIESRRQVAAARPLFPNQINTIPGLTSISMYPKRWEHAGIAYSDLIDRLITLVLEWHAARSRTRYACRSEASAPWSAAA